MLPTYIAAPLEFKLVDSKGIPCRAKFWPSQKSCQTYLVFIPGMPAGPSPLIPIGNPGIISYYDEFLTALHQESPSTTVLGMSLAGHEDFELPRPLSLQQQIENKINLVDTITASPPFSLFEENKPRLILMGHSVGAYIALQVLKQRPQNVDNVFLLFPTISNISQGSRFAGLASLLTSIPYHAKITAFIVLLLRFLIPLPLLALLLKFAYTLPGSSLETTLEKFLVPASVESCCHLARYEFREIQELDADVLSKYAKRITAHYAAKDDWVPAFARDQAIRVINGNGGDAVICREGIPHGFSLVHGPQMAKKVSLWISTLLYPITKSPALVPKDGPLDDVLSNPGAWSMSDQDPRTLAMTSPDAEHKQDRKTSIGCGAVVRERLIKDLK